MIHVAHSFVENDVIFLIPDYKWPLAKIYRKFTQHHRTTTHLYIQFHYTRPCDVIHLRDSSIITEIWFPASRHW